MAYDYSICDLDSSIMNFGVAKINYSDISINPIEIINLSRPKGISLVYIRSNALHDKEHEELQYFPNIKFIMQNLKYVMELNNENKSSVNNFPLDIIEYNEQILTDPLKKLAFECNKHSHLRKDTLINKKHADKLYLQWMQNSLIDKDNGGVFVAKVKCKIIGMLVFSKKINSINVDLISVEKTMRRQKYATKLLEALACYARKNGALSITVETQLVNVPANKLYENVGFKVINKQNIFHCWI